MATRSKNKRTIEFGDFQTPPRLAADACRLLGRLGISPASIVEPTCGLGHFALAAARQFPEARQVLGAEINPHYVSAAQDAFRAEHHSGLVRIVQADFFEFDWSATLRDLPEPLLIVGNPPWVTNAEVSSLGGRNLPTKGNRQGYRGIVAITGKSNFDISEWMIAHLLEQLGSRTATLAMLCKTNVARRILCHVSTSNLPVVCSTMYLIDAAKHFEASVDACFLVCRTGPGARSEDCSVYPDLGSMEAEHSIGYRDGQFLADIRPYERWKHLQGAGPYRWRSGIKHDCARVMELLPLGRSYLNGFGEVVDLEDEYLFPMLKSSDLAQARMHAPRRQMLVTQKETRDDTSAIRYRAPRTWAYLERYAAYWDRRASSVYKGKARFAIFGVGPYAFAPWKVAISGLYKRLDFRVVGNMDGKPIVLDDTAYLLPCNSREEAGVLESLLNSPVAQEFYGTFVHWDAKRPVTAELLNRLNLSALAAELGNEEIVNAYRPDDQQPRRAVFTEESAEGSLFSIPD